MPEGRSSKFCMIRHELATLLSNFTSVFNSCMLKSSRCISCILDSKISFRRFTSSKAGRQSMKRLGSGECVCLLGLLDRGPMVQGYN